jgi:hypothetical protein
MNKERTLSPCSLILASRLLPATVAHRARAPLFAFVPLVRKKVFAYVAY